MDPAPARGRYDRQLSGAERAARQRERLLEATARAVLESERTRASVAAIVAHAGTARNTFYVFFRDVREAEAQLLSSVIDVLRARTDAQTKPGATLRERFDALLVAWTEAIDDRRLLARAAFEIALADRRGGLSRIGAQLRSQLRRATSEARRSDALTTPADELRLTAAAAAMESLLLWYVDHAGGQRDVVELGTDMLLRAFR